MGKIYTKSCFFQSLSSSAAKVYCKVLVHHGPLPSKSSCKTKKTDSAKVSNNSVISFDQSFNFALKSEALKEAGVTIQVMEATNLLDKGEHNYRACVCAHAPTYMKYYNTFRV